MRRALSSLPDLRTRRRRPEIMDQPGLDPADHEQALRALARVNRLSGTARRIWAVVRQVHQAVRAGGERSSEPFAPGPSTHPVPPVERTERESEERPVPPAERTEPGSEERPVPRVERTEPGLEERPVPPVERTEPGLEGRPVHAFERRERSGGTRPVRVLDVACGGGDVLRGVSALAGRHGVPVELAGCDVSPVALEHARRAAPTLRFFRLDVRDDSLPGGYDVVCSTLFLHHLADAEVVRLLVRMKEATARALFVEDLRRSRTGLLLARVALPALTRSGVARTDGPRSVEAAFRIDEMGALCRQAGLADAAIRPCWPERFTVLWSRA